jgi:predicted acylesterase/phospholipase RssA
MFLVTFVLVSCATVDAWESVPEQFVDTVDVSGYYNIRSWGDEAPANLKAIAAKKVAQTRRRYAGSRLPRSISLLSISGGGSYGAYGAGLLAGWGDSGRRPAFEAITGVSAGALTAPFVFLGRQYDSELKEIWTSISTKDVLRSQGLGGVLVGTAAADSSPLLRLISKYVDEDFLDEIGSEHNRGRRLYVGTTNLEAQRPVVWDMGEIAVSGQPNRVELFRKILLASASVPGLFPPVKIQVTVDGESYDEVHVDGGTTEQLFLYPARVNLSELGRRYGFSPRRRMYIIRNGILAPEWQKVEPKTLKIASRAITTVTKYQGRGDILRLYALARRDRIDFNLASIPVTFDVPANEPFDQAQMNALFDLGYGAGSRGYKWRKRLPVF